MNANVCPSGTLAETTDAVALLALILSQVVITVKRDDKRSPNHNVSGNLTRSSIQSLGTAAYEGKDKQCHEGVG